MKKGFLIAGLLLLTGLTGFAQTLVLEEKGYTSPKQDYEGRDNYRHFYLSIGGISADANESFQVGGSLNFNSGFRYVNGLSKRYGMGVGLEYDYLTYRVLDPENGVLKEFDPIRENLDLHTLGLEWIHRVRLGKPASELGYFLDFGLYFAGVFNANSNADYEPFKYSGSGEVIHDDVNFVWHWHRGITARFGFNKYVIYIKYRTNRGLKSNAPFTQDIPQLSFGFQLGLH